MIAKRQTASTTEAVDDYLKAILELSGPDERRVSSNALAAHLDVRAASVTGMLQKLASQRPSFVKYEKHHGVRLTDAGKRFAHMATDARKKLFAEHLINYVPIIGLIRRVLDERPTHTAPDLDD